MSTQSSQRIASILDILVHEEHISAQESENIVANAAAARQPVIRYMLEQKILKSPKDLMRYVARAFKTEFVDLSDYAVPDELSSLIPSETARLYHVIPISVEDTALYVATTLEHLEDIRLFDLLRKRTGFRNITFRLSLEEDIDRSINDMYRLDNELKVLGIGAKSMSDGIGANVDSIDEAQTVVEESDAAKFVRLSITQAVIDRASDILFESHETHMKLRYRIDGVFHEKQRVSRSISDEIISVIKIQSNLDISVRRRAQDGRMHVVHEGEKIDLRVNIFPIQDGENVTMRILDNSQANLRLDQLGFSENNLKRFRSALHKPQGMILLTGPTGSGKSVTLYSGLREIATPEKNTYTIEDPIEYRVPNVKQSQVEVKQQWSYPDAMRALMRSAPDIILVGEIRDHETAKMGLEAGMTGHLVLSTLHTNSASEVPNRLMDIGVQAHIVASTLSAMVGQRLVRRLCSKCKIPHTPEPAELLAVNYPWSEGEPLPQFYGPKPGGCKECSGIGFRGRTAAHEVLVVDDTLRSMISRRASADEIEAYAISTGMSKMMADGLDKVRQGITTIPEVLKSVV